MLGAFTAGFGSHGNGLDDRLRSDHVEGLLQVQVHALSN
jgi:hypothetical protein